MAQAQRFFFKGNYAEALKELEQIHFKNEESSISEKEATFSTVLAEKDHPCTFSLLLVIVYFTIKGSFFIKGVQVK